MEELENKIVKTLFPKEAYNEFLQGDIAKRYLERKASLIEALSESYVVNEKTGILKNMSQAEMAEAYACYYLPINFYKLNFLLEQISLPEKVYLLDYGAGTGTATFAVMRHTQTLDATLFDKSESMLQVAKRLLQGEKLHYDAVTNLNQALEKRYNLVVIANALNEFSESEEDELIKNLEQVLTQNGFLIILEPALLVTARRLMRFREKLLATEEYGVVFPCTHSQPCPMLEIQNDWCHAALDGLNSRLVTQIDELTGYNKHRIKYAALIARRGAGESENGFARIVGVPNKEKSGVSAKICAKGLFEERVFAKNAQTSDGKKIKKAKLFDKIALDG